MKKPLLEKRSKRKPKKSPTIFETESEREARIEKWVPEIKKIADKIYYSYFVNLHREFNLDEIRSLCNFAFVVNDKPEIPGKSYGSLLRTVFFRFVIDTIRKADVYTRDERAKIVEAKKKGEKNPLPLRVIVSIEVEYIWSRNIPEGEGMVKLVEMIADDTSPDPFDEARNNDDLEKIQTYLKFCKDRDREIFQMIFFECLPAADIARSFGISEARVSQTKTRMLNELRKLLSE